jgi:biotin carboxylase
MIPTDNSNKNLLSVGAGPEQVYSIVKAKSLGYSVVAIDVDPCAPGLAFCDRPIVLDISNEDAVIKVAKHHKIRATLPVPIGRLLTTQGAVNDDLGLSGVTRAAAVNCTDKAAFHACMAKAGLAVPWYLAYACSSDLAAADASDWPFPLVLKPTHGSGSRDVVVLSSFDDWAAVRVALGERTSAETDSITIYDRGAVVQSFVNGMVLGIDGAIKAGHTVVTCVREKEMTPLPYRVELGHLAPNPPSLPSIALTKILESLQAALIALGVNNSVFHSDLIWTPESKIVLIELSARPSGAAISSKLVPQSTGVDFLAEAIRLQCTRDGDFEPLFTRPSFLRYWSGSGLVKRVPDVETLSTLPGFCEAEIALHVGQIIKPPTNTSELICNGYVLASSDNWPDLRKVYHRSISMFEIG